MDQEKGKYTDKIIEARIRKNPQKYLAQVNEMNSALKSCDREHTNLTDCLLIHQNNVSKCIECIKAEVICFKNSGVIID